MACSAFKSNSHISAAFPPVRIRSFVGDESDGRGTKPSLQLKVVASSVTRSAESKGPVPPLTTGWRSASRLVAERGGSYAVLRRKLEMLRQVLAEDIINSLACTADQAMHLVDDHLLGVRQGKTALPALSASPEAVRIIDQGFVCKTAIPIKPVGWFSARELQRTVNASDTHIRSILLQLRAALVQDVQQSLACSNHRAEELVSDFLIGLKKPSGPGAVGVHASPDALRLFDELSRNDPAFSPIKPEGWLTAYQLKKDFIGNVVTLRSKLLQLRSMFVDEVQLTLECSRADAFEIVDHQLIGNRTAGGRPGLAASPDAVRAAEENGVFRHR